MFSALMGKNPYVHVDDLEEQIRRHARMEDDLPPPNSRAERNMAWGKLHETDGFAEYAVKYVSPDPEVWGKRVKKIGFVVDDTFKIGVSPDGFVDDDGIIEIKCPVSRRFYDKIPEYYEYQVMALLGVCKREWCDLVQWTPDGISVKRYTLDKDLWERMKTEAIRFWDYHENHYRAMKVLLIHTANMASLMDVGEPRIETDDNNKENEENN
jgi:hypothetical protein